MALINIRKARLLLRDGSAGTAQTNAVNKVAGYSSGYKGPIEYDGTGTLKVGMIVTIGAHQYLVVDLPTAGTFTPAGSLKAALTDNDVISSVLYTNEIFLKIGDGNLSYETKKNVEYMLDAGKIDEVREGDEVPLDVSFDVQWTEYTSTGDILLDDAFSGVDSASTWVSSDSDTCRPFGVNIIVQYDAGCSNPPTQILFPDFRWESKSFDLRGGKFSVKGKCNVTAPTVTVYA